MKIAYLMNSYPMVSTTFIGREIAGLEAEGLKVDRYAIRRWDGTLVDPADLAEAARSDYLLEDGAAKLIGGFLAEAVANPKGMLRAIKLWRRLLSAAGGAFGGGFARHAAYLLEAVALRRRIRRHPVAHVHAHFSSNAAAAAMMCRALGGPSYSFTVHGPDELFEPARASLGLKIEHAAFVACISHFCRSQCMIFAPPEAWDRLRIVHCGVRPDRYAPSPEALAARTGKRIVFVGRMSQIKGGPVLLEAFAAARKTHPEAELLLVGDGEQRPMLEEMTARLGLGDVVRFLGFRSQDDVRALMAEADILALASFAEGVPVVLMEAMASGLPVVASRVAGVGELVEDGVSGFAVHAGDVESFGARFAELLNDADLRARMGAAGRAKVAAEFDLDAETAWLGRLIRGAASGAAPEGLRPR